jgi:hypothetical protein
MSDTHLHQPDLGALRTVAEGAELAHAVSRLVTTDGWPLADSDPLAPLARDIARSLAEAGLTVHHCVRQDPLYRLGGACLLPIPAESSTGRSGIAVSRTTHTLLLCDWARYSTYRGTHQIMNAALGGILRAFGLYRFRTRCRISELRFGAAGGLGQDRGSCLSVCCT